MTYFGYVYAIIVAFTIAIYGILPKKIRPLLLLVVSFGFFFLASKKLLVFLCLSILSIYIGGYLLNKIEEKRDSRLEKLEDKEEKKRIKNGCKLKKKLLLIVLILFNLSFLFFFKYLNFFSINMNLLFSKFHVNHTFKIVKHLAPIGISYYTLQAIAYIVDVYNGKIKADNNIIRLSLFLSFFPQIMEGPIARYSDTAEDLYKGHEITSNSLTKGVLRISYGCFKKFVVADRLNGIVKVVFSNYTSLGSLSCFLGIAAYTVMLYMEFSGTMDVVIGTGEIFGVKMHENFRQPFFSKNISEFWTRWHITLGTWFKDYVFYPVSLSKPLKKITIKARKFLGAHFGAIISGSIALLCVWLLNGLWHGAGYTFILFGLYHFIMILLGNIFSPLIIKICNKLHINRENTFYRIFQSLKMTILVFFGELFFRATSVKEATIILKRIFSFIPLKTKELMAFGLDMKDFIVLVIGIIIVFIISLLREKNVDIRENISQKNTFKRWAIIYIIILIIIIFGAYGSGYAPVDPIYADF